MILELCTGLLFVNSSLTMYFCSILVGTFNYLRLGVCTALCMEWDKGLHFNCYGANIPTVPALRNYILYSDLAVEFSLNEIYDSV